jgi:DNA topoisomerase-1
MLKNLVIVESPAKAKTIEGFLGKDFTVKSSVGHIRDLPDKNMGIDIEGGFTPEYVISPEKKKTVSELKKLAKDSEQVWLATDEDREGEAIAWHLNEALGLDPDRTKRIVFHEITKTAIHRAVENPRTIDINLVNAQQARRVLDRLVGFELSPVLWRKVKPGLSAGRVQSVAVRLIVEREVEIEKFTPEVFFRVTAIFENEDGKKFSAQLKDRLTSTEEVEQFIEEVRSASHSVKSIEKKPGTRNPAPPFTTSTLQQEASRKLGFSVGRTMSVAQRLYEAGLITYMRTDSVNLSDQALGAARTEIEAKYGSEYAHTRKFSTKNKSAQEAHEAIRPTYFNREFAGEDEAQKKLYSLIWKRAIASQMSQAQLERTEIVVDCSSSSRLFEAKGEVIRFDGFLKVYMEGTDDEEEEQEGMLPALDRGESLKRQELTATERFTKHPPRFTEASLVKKMEELGIGRPSTYAPTISTIIKREYVEKANKDGVNRDYRVWTIDDQQNVQRTEATERTGAEKNKLFPTDMGRVVNDFLVEQFGQIMDFQFTAKVEEEFDKIAEGQEQWNAMIENFYGDFHNNVEDVKENAGRATGERLLGVHPETGKNVYVKIGRYGPMVQIGEAGEDEKPQFASLLKDQQINTVTLEEVLELFKLPRDLGEYEGEPVISGVGRYGPFVRFGKKFISLKEIDPLEVSFEQAVEVIEEFKQRDANKYVAVFEGDPKIEVLRGPYGIYLKSGKKNYRIPKGVDPEKLDRAACEEIIAKAPKGRSTRKRK